VGVRLALAAVATVLVLLSAILPALGVAAGLVATNGRVNAIVVLVGAMAGTLWWALIWFPLRALERAVWESEAYAPRAALGAILGFAGWLLRDALFVTGPDSDYRAPAYALLYLVTFAGALVVVAASPAPKGSGPSRGNSVPHNKWMQLTRSAHGQGGRGPRS
jgi:hypothetical protein